jgi:hypothetical protein
VDVDLLGRYAGGLRGHRQRDIGVLRSDPHVHAIRLHMRDGIERLHRRVRDDRHVVGGFDRLGGARHRGIDVAVVTSAPPGQASTFPGGTVAVGGAGRADFPLDLQRIERLCARK